MPKYRIMGGIVLILMITLACSLPTVSAPTRPPTSAPLSTEELKQFEETLNDTLNNPDLSGEVSIQITEQQINALVVNSSEPMADFTITEPQIHLTDGKVEFYARITQGTLTAQTQVVLVPVVSGDGQPRLQIESIKLGPLPVPDTLVKQVEDRVNDLFYQSLLSSDSRLKVKSVTITEGLMTVTGERQ